MVIEVTPKLWRLEVVNKYLSPDYADNIDEVIFDFVKYGKAVYRPRKSWEEDDRTNLITFDEIKHREELRKNIIVST